MLLLLNGVEPVKAVGYTSLLALAWAIEATLITKVQDLIPNKLISWLIPLAFVALGSIASGTLM